MATVQEVHEQLLAKISTTLQQPLTPLGLLYLAEAYAWVASPSSPHGGVFAPPPG